ncbi:translation initiation factor IF-2-like [Leopardus geoffroyi]|uniref:translation initiation factor IF-2-like n=1 Tax=Leopardus geoffroyi TaxID=46844 RepID=UPI001E25EF9E|nr:translation initiation factor IF-2-like [Leopardus geoffroyi]XP_045314383.1 translation initiation factor IF-2-like [Leopardus geoffroyi]
MEGRGLRWGVGRGPKPRNPAGASTSARHAPVSPRHPSRPTRASGGPLPRAAALGAARRPCLDRGKGWRWGREAGIGTGPGDAREDWSPLQPPPDPGMGREAAPEASISQPGARGPRSQRRRRLRCWRQRLEMGELTLASRGTRTAAPLSTHSWPCASISVLPAQPPPHAVRAPTALSLPESDPRCQSGSPRPWGWALRDREVGAGCQEDYSAPTRPHPGPAQCSERRGGCSSGGGGGGGVPKRRNPARASTSARRARVLPGHPSRPTLASQGAPSPRRVPGCSQAAVPGPREGVEVGACGGNRGRPGAATPAMPGASLSRRQRLRWGKRRWRTPASLCRGPWGLRSRRRHRPRRFCLRC